MNTFKIVNDVRKTQQQLNAIYVLTSQEYASLDSLHLSNKVINLLLRKSILHRISEGKHIVKYKWTGIKPTFALSYDFHHQFRGNNKTYRDIKKKAENPELLEPNEIIEVLALISQENGKSNGEQGKSEKLNFNEEILELNFNKDADILQVSEELKPSPLFKELPSMEAVIDFKILKDALTNPNQSILLGLLSDILEFLMENREILKSIQNTQRMVVAISKSNQNNLFIQSAVLMNLVKVLMLFMNDSLNSEDKQLQEIKTILGEVMKHLRSQVNTNNSINTRYG